MNRETIIQMAREAGFELDETDGYWVSFTHEIEALVALAVAKEREEMLGRIRHLLIQAENRGAVAEREACAKVCEELAQYTLDAQNNELSSLENVMLRQISKLGHNKCAQAIRARGEA